MTAGDDRQSDGGRARSSAEGGAEVDRPDDDLQLAGMRSLWKSMPDEEPSDRGLAALMTAARAKAEEMKPRESWWQRVLVQLRRPPVLALATVVLLVGGGVVISQRGDMKVKAVVDERSPAATAPVVPPAVEAVAPASATPGAPADPAPVEQKVVVPAEPPAPARPAPAKKAGKAAAKSEAQPDPRGPTSRATAPASAPTTEGIEKERGFGGASPTAPMAIAAGDEDAASPAEGAKPRPARRAAPPIEGEDRGSTIDELVKQCEAAAVRGDCAAAKSLAQRIQQADPKVYRARVTANAKIASCL